MVEARVLLVEDEAIIAMDFEQHLIECGYDVVGIADTGMTAVQMARNEAPDIILMDIMLQGKVDGISAAHMINAELDIPIVYVTSHSNQATLKRARETKHQGYILKPISREDLQNVIQRVLKKRR
jgi:CheY-like chemotaxis protein